MKYTIILPSYNEAENLDELLPRLIQTLDACIPDHYEIIVVDTCEPIDNTLKICDKFGVGHVFRRGGNRYGDAVRTGISEARGKYSIFMDADGSHPPEFIPELISISDKYDIVIASRYVEDGDTDNHALSVFLSRLVNIAYSVALGINVKDLSNSLKLYPTAWLKSLELRANNLDIIEEILYKLCKQNKTIRIKEIPFKFKKRLHGTTKRKMLPFITSYFLTLVKLRFGLY